MSSERKGKWVDLDTLEVVETVPKADNSGVRAATVTDAKKLGLGPSTTTVTDLVASWSLTDWMVKNSISTAAAYPYDKEARGEPDEESVEKYVKMIRAKADEYSKYTATRGTKIHGHVNRYFERSERPDDGASNCIIDAILKKFESLEVTDIETEKVCGSREDGFAGQPDLYTVRKDKSTDLWDLKTTDLSKFKTPHTSWKLQLGGYNILKKGESKLWQIVSDRLTGETIFLPHEHAYQWTDGFSHLFELWCCICCKGGYDPRRFQCS